MSGPQPNHFDRGKPFYPLLTSYMSQLVGFKELAIRGFAGGRDLEEVLAKAVARGALSVSSEEESAQTRSSLNALMGPLQLRSEYQKDRITVEVDLIAQELAHQGSYLLESQIAAAGTVFILAHEISKDTPWHDDGPLWEFLRHCRNAAAHGGRFDLLHGEPLRPAQWGSFQITSNLHQLRLLKAPDGCGMLSLGDPIRLLWDIEQAYPQMTV